MDQIEQDAKQYYLEVSIKDKIFPALATCQTLMHFLINDTSATFLEYSKKMTKIASTLKELVPLSEVESVSEIFIRFTTLKSSEFNTIDEAKKVAQERGDLFLNKVVNCKDKISKNSNGFITDGAIILVHSYSRVVLKLLIDAQNLNKKFTIYVTECADQSGKLMFNHLKKAGIKTILIKDSAIGFYMEIIDIVFVGAEGVMENGGIINMIGTLPVAICAKTMNKPFYVLVESYKFIRLYPVNQRDIPDRIKFKHNLKQLNYNEQDLEPLVDYTPPSFITLLLTDLGTLTTAAVSDVLIHLYL